MNKLIGLVAIIAALIIGAIFLSKCRNNTTDQVSAITYNRNDSTTHYRDLYNTEHALRMVDNAKSGVIIAMLGKKGDSLAQRLGIQKKQFQNVLDVMAQASGSFTTGVDTVFYPDTSDAGIVTQRPTGLKFTYNDKWMSQVGTIDSVVKVDYTVYVPITLTQYWKREHKFLGVPYGRKTYFIDGFSENDNVKLTNLENYRVAESKPKLWHFIAAVGGGLVTGILLSR